MPPNHLFIERSDLPTAVVIGAGGMSMAIAHRLGQTHRVIVASLDPPQLKRGIGQLKEYGVICHEHTCDITNQHSVDDLSGFLAGIGRIDTLAHVAALSPSMAEWQAVITVNLIGAARIERAAQRFMSAGCAAVFISSLSAHSQESRPGVLDAIDEPLEAAFIERLQHAVNGPISSGSAYSLSKLGINRMVQRQTSSWGRRGARIMSLSPGLIDTPMGILEDNNGSKDAKSRLRDARPLQRDGTMPDIADAVEFLTSQRARYITGIDLLVDGGLAAALRHSR